MQENSNVHIREKCLISKLQNTEKKLLNIRERIDCEGVLLKKYIYCFPQPTFLVKCNILSPKNPSQGLTVARVYKLGKVFVG